MDIDRYEEFLPWCVASRVTERQDNVVFADLVVGFKMFRERFSSEVRFKESAYIEVKYIHGPFRHLTNKWTFIPTDDNNQTKVDFYISFEFRSRVLESLIGRVFEDAVLRMIEAFEQRAEEVYTPTKKSISPGKAAV